MLPCRYNEDVKGIVHEPTTYRLVGNFGKRYSMPSRQNVPLGSRTSRYAFTLVELLVVIAIIGILMGLLLPAINSARESGRRTQCINQLTNIVKAMVNYESANGSFPAGRAGCDAYTGKDSPCGTTVQGSQTSGTSAFLAILPQLDESPLYSSFAPLAKGAVYPAKSDASTSGWSTPPPASGSATLVQALLARPPVFVCPSDTAKPDSTNLGLNPPTKTSSYALVIGELGANPVVVPSQSGNITLPAADEVHQKYFNNGPFVYASPRRSADVRDGLSNTMFVGETTDGHLPETMNFWPLSVAYLSSMRSTNNKLNPQPGDPTVVPVGISNSGIVGLASSVTGAFSSRHPAGANFAFGDGHVRYIANTIDIATYQALSTIAGKEPVDATKLDAAP
jgi:prepilin-type N-terminal cleavage/methylation domain-containing protein/prepilin-type processing-associated H-X9-DG protein